MTCILLLPSICNIQSCDHVLLPHTFSDFLRRSFSSKRYNDMKSLRTRVAATHGKPLRCLDYAYSRPLFQNLLCLETVVASTQSVPYLSAPEVCMKIPDMRGLDINKRSVINVIVVIGRCNHFSQVVVFCLHIKTGIIKQSCALAIPWGAHKPWTVTVHAMLALINCNKANIIPVP